VLGVLGGGTGEEQIPEPVIALLFNSMNFFVQLQSSLLIFFSGLVVDQHGTWLVLPCRKLN
jgi:hypothetical protein